MNKVRIAFLALVVALAGSAFTTPYFAVQAPCTAYFFADNKVTPSTGIVVSDLIIPTNQTDVNSNNLPDELTALTTSGSDLPASITCPNSPVNICVVGYGADDFQENISTGIWELKTTASANCVVRYNP